MCQGDKLVPGARDVLTDIFKSCVHSEQMLSLTPTKPLKVSDIYLSKEQINSQTPGNLLHTFFTNVRPPKKVLEDQLTQVYNKCIANICTLKYLYIIYTVCVFTCQNNVLVFVYSDSTEVWHSQAQ